MQVLALVFLGNCTSERADSLGVFVPLRLDPPTETIERGVYSGQHRLAGPPRFEYGRLAHPPVIFSQERLKIEQRLPAAQKFIRDHALNEVIPGDVGEIGIIVLGGLTNGLLRALARLDLADLYGTRAFRSMCSMSSIRWCPRK